MIEKSDIEGVSKLLSHTTIINSDFEKTIEKSEPGDFVYLDPPYIPIDSTSSFTSYHADGFGLSDQKRIAQKMSDLKKSGIKAMCSNSDTPLTREVYKELNFKTIQAPRMLSAKASGRGNISELVITNF
jgi:DNA adenine methylase